MSEYTKADFAKLLHRKNSYVTTNIDRGKIIADASGRINTSHPLNKAFVENFFLKNDIDGNPKAKAKPETLIARKAKAAFPDDEQAPKAEMIADTSFENSDGTPNVKLSEAKYKQHLAAKTAKDVVLLDLKIEKLKGEVIPAAPIANIVFQYKQYLITQQNIFFEGFLNEVAHKYDFTPDDIANYRGQYKRGLNACYLTADKEFVSNLEGVLREYSIKRGVGERN